MDLDRPVTYRGYELNTVAKLAGSGQRRGCLLEEADFSAVQAVGYTEKRAQGDGLDASDVYLGSRIVQLRGTVYGETRADTFDRLQDLRAALSPTGAYADEPTLKGYVPLEFDVPTQQVGDFPDGWKLMMLLARPRGLPAWNVRRDTGSGGEHLKGGAIAWNATLECKDPRVYLRTPVWEFFNEGNESGTLINKGDYPAPVDILLDVTGAGAGTFRLEMGGSILNITIPAGGPMVIRYSATLGGILTTQQGGLTDVLRMDLLAVDANANIPHALPGANPYVITTTGPTLNEANTRLMFNEAFA